jgi:triacylglycerol lipase
LRDARGQRRLPPTASCAIKSEVEFYRLIFEPLDCSHDLEGSMNLVFASGFLVPQHVLEINYFDGVKDHFDGKHKMLFADVGPLDSCEKRADKLADAINKEFATGPIHIIAHSMAGLDSRSLIGRDLHELSSRGRIASLTTLSTPHRGSPVADLLVGPEPFGLRRLLYEAATQILEQLKIPIGALGDLTTAGASQIPDVRNTHPHIRYRSCFAAGRPKPFLPTCLVLEPTHDFVTLETGQPNDGVVARDSAHYGEFQIFQCDHADLVGHNLDPPNFSKFRFDHLAMIDALIADL